MYLNPERGCPCLGRVDCNHAICLDLSHGFVLHRVAVLADRYAVWHRNLSAAVRAQDVSIAITLLPRRLGLATLVVKIMSALLKLKARALASAALSGSSCSCASSGLCQTFIVCIPLWWPCCWANTKCPCCSSSMHAQCGTPASFPAGRAQ